MRAALRAVGSQPSACTARTSSPSKKQLPSVMRQQASVKGVSAAGSVAVTNAPAAARDSGRGRTGWLASCAAICPRRSSGAPGSPSRRATMIATLVVGEALQQVEHEPQRRAIRPVRVVDRR